MAIPFSSKTLLVEGETDKYAIVELMKKNGIPWPSDKHPVDIRAAGGEKLFCVKQIPVWLKSHANLGVILDADDDIPQKWKKLKDLCLPFFPNFPDAPIQEGLIIFNHEARFGAWIMPDNSSTGMIETFMKNLIPSGDNRLYSHADASTKKAKEFGAKFRDCHTEKAVMYAWLSWQDQPAQTLGRALMTDILDAKAPYADDFIKWFKSLYLL